MVDVHAAAGATVRIEDASDRQLAMAVLAQLEAGMAAGERAKVIEGARVDGSDDGRVLPDGEAGEAGAGAQDGVADGRARTDR
jgi:hypothetical protein